MCWHRACGAPIVVSPKQPTGEAASAEPTKEAVMTPPNGTHNLMTNTASKAGVGFGVAESPYGDAPEHLTFDEMREMPMHMALGFDIED